MKLKSLIVRTRIGNQSLSFEFEEIRTKQQNSSSVLLFNFPLFSRPNWQTCMGGEIGKRTWRRERRFFLSSSMRSRRSRNEVESAIAMGDTERELLTSLNLNLYRNLLSLHGGLRTSRLLQYYMNENSKTI